MALQRAEIIQIVNDRTKEVKAQISKGKKSGEADFLWVRHWIRDGKGQPINIRNIPNTIPVEFWEMCIGV